MAGYNSCMFAYGQVDLVPMCACVDFAMDLAWAVGGFWSLARMCSALAFFCSLDID